VEEATLVRRLSLNVFSRLEVMRAIRVATGT
jgi:hypothetical protein